MSGQYQQVVAVGSKDGDIVATVETDSGYHTHLYEPEEASYLAARIVAELDIDPSGERDSEPTTITEIESGLYVSADICRRAGFMAEDAARIYNPDPGRLVVELDTGDADES